MLGAVGDDSNGKWYLENLAKSGVICDHVLQKDDISTGVAPIRVQHFDNNFILSIQTPKN